MWQRLLKIFGIGASELDCRQVRELSSDYIDQELDTRTEDRVRGHLERCGPCRSFVRTLRATVDLLRHTPRQEPPQGFVDRVRSRLRQQDR